MQKAKKKLLVFLASAMSFCLALSAAFGLVDYTVDAEATAVQTTSLFTASSTTFVEGKGSARGSVEFSTGETLIGETKGLKVSKITGTSTTQSGKHWYYAVNETFYGNSGIEYVFTENGYEGVSFVYTDLQGERVVTVIVVPEYNANYYGGVVAGKDYVAASTYAVHTLAGTAKQTVTFTKDFTAGATNGGNKKALTDLGSGFLPKRGEKNAIKLEFGASALSVKMANASGALTEVVAFDYATYPAMKNIRDGGYKLCITDGDGRAASDDGVIKRGGWVLNNNSAAATPSLISINGVALSGATVTPTVSHAEISYAGESFDGTNYVIGLKKGAELNDFTYQTFLGYTSAGYGDLRYPTGGETNTVSYAGAAAFATKEYGDYPITVTCDGGSKDYVVRVGMQASDLISTSTQLNMTAGKAIGSFVGTEITPKTNSRDSMHWKYTIGGTFYGNSEMEYTFATASSGYEEGFSITVADVNEQRVFQAVIVPDVSGVANKNYFGGVFAETERNSETKEFPFHTLTAAGAKTQVTLISKFSTGVAGAAELKNHTRLGAIAGGGFLPKYDEKFTFKLEFGESALSVKMMTATGTMAEVYAFDYATYPEVAALRTNGYKLRVADGDDGGDGGDRWALFANWCSMSPSLLSINGTATDSNAVGVSFSDATISYTGEFVEGGKNVIELDETDELSSFRVVAKYTIGGTLLLGDFDVRAMATERFSTKAIGDHDFTFAYGDATKEYVVRVKANVPQFSLNEVEGYTVLSKSENQAVTAAKTDVLAEDKKDGTLDAANVQISVKKPGATSYTPYDSFTFNPEEFGVYTIRYTIVNSASVEGSIERTVRYVASRPQVTLSAEIDTLGFVGKKIALPEANAGATLAVVFNGEALTLTNREFTPEEEGNYEVTYTYTDENGVTAVKQVTIVVREDYEVPVITVEEAPNGLRVGDLLTVPSATATDNSDGNVTVKVEILFNGLKVGEKQVTTAEVGYYTIVYTATDRAGNVANKYVDVFVGAVETGEPFENPPMKTWQILVIVGVCVAVVAIGGVTALLIVKSKKKKAVKEGEEQENEPKAAKKKQQNKKQK